MIKQEPRLEWVDLIAFFLIYLGLLFFAIILHILAINTGGATQSVMNTLFITYLSIYISTLVFGLVAIIIQLLRWLTWAASTPSWQKKGEF